MASKAEKAAALKRLADAKRTGGGIGVRLKVRMPPVVAPAPHGRRSAWCDACRVLPC